MASSRSCATHTEKAAEKLIRQNAEPDPDNAEMQHAAEEIRHAGPDDHHRKNRDLRCVPDISRAAQASDIDDHEDLEKGAGKDKDAFGGIVEVAEPAAGELDLFKAKNGGEAKNELRIVEIEFLEKEN